MTPDERQDELATASERDQGSAVRVNRRQFVQRSGALVATTAVGLGVTDNAAAQTEDNATPIPTEEQYPEVPSAPETPPDPAELVALTEQEAATVEALTARIMPGSSEDPGAREAGVVTYIDHMLAFNRGFVEKIYHQGPWAETYEGDEPPPAEDIIWIQADEIERYGYQSRLTPLEVYQQGIAAVDRFAQEQFGQQVAELAEGDQDAIVQALLDNEATGFEDVPFSPESFFHVLRRHTMEGMFSDPAYGGNRNMAGWRLIGYPGAQRAYLPLDIITEGTDLEPQPLDDLPHFHPGRPAVGDEAPVLPVAGSDEET